MNKDKFIEIEGKIYKKDDIVQLSKAMYIDFKKYPAFKKVNPLLKEVQNENYTTRTTNKKTITK